MTQLPKDKAGPLARYVATIQSQRGDYNGRVLSIRQEDLRSLAVIYDKSPADLTEELIGWGVLDSDARGAVESLLTGGAAGHRSPAQPRAPRRPYQAPRQPSRPPQRRQP